MKQPYLRHEIAHRSFELCPIGNIGYFDGACCFKSNKTKLRQSNDLLNVPNITKALLHEYCGSRNFTTVYQHLFDRCKRNFSTFNLQVYVSPPSRHNTAAVFAFFVIVFDATRGVKLLVSLRDNHIY